MEEPVKMPLAELLSQVVPGTVLRDGVERVLRAHMGALVVLGDGPDVLAICSGGFHIDAAMTPQRLSELAKMDGAIILDPTVQRISWANVHLMPDPAAATSETGTRHRTAERVARCIGVPVIAVSEEMGTITLYRGGEKRLLRAPEGIGNRANHMLQTLGRFRERLLRLCSCLTGSELDGRVIFREVVVVAQHAEMVLRFARELDELLDELGDHGQMLRLELDELVAGVEEERVLVLEDYVSIGRSASSAEVLARVAQLSAEDLLGLEGVAEALMGASADPFGLDDVVASRGLRALKGLSSLESEVLERLVRHFGGLPGLARAPLAELLSVGGLGDPDARALRERLTRVLERSSTGEVG